MEIREGIRYEYQSGKFATVKQSLSNPKQFYGVFNDDKSNSCDYNSASWVKDFKSGSLKLIEYPYKVGDWVYDKEDIYVKSHNTPKIVQITDIKLDKIYVNNEKQSVSLDSFNYHYRPCFKNEIPGYSKSKKKIIKEDLTQLRDLLLKIGV
jgi:hypothetical protein